MNPLLTLLGEVTVIFALALLAARLASKARAAVRHLILACAFGVALILPLATLVSPKITVEIDALPAREATPPVFEPVIAHPLKVEPAISPIEAAEPTDFAATALATITDIPAVTPAQVMSGASWLLLTWAVVALITVVPVCVGLWRLRAIRRRGQPWPEGAARLVRLVPAMRGRQPILLLHEEIAAPITDGLLRPAITLPASAVAWSQVHLANALLHEMEHVRRHDWAVHLAARTVCALYWFHPLAWIAWRALRLEAERACDDAVLARADAAVYAEQLLELARRLTHKPALPGMQMASNSDLSSRIRAALDSERPRGRAGRKAMTSVVLAAVTIVVLLAPLRAVGPLHASEIAAQIPLAAAAPMREVGPRQTPARVGAAAPSLPADSPLRYSGVRITGGEDPHAYGPQLELCRQDDRWTGYITEYTGFPADPPFARLENLRLDERTGTLSFSAQLTTGVELQSGSYVPARRLHEFSGRIDADAVTGSRVVKAVAPSTAGETREEIAMQRETSNPIATSCKEWRDVWNRRAGFRNAGDPSPPRGAAPKAIVASILSLVQSALADETTRALDEVMRPITGLHHVQRHARAVLDDNSNDAAYLATNYIEVINGLNNTADLAMNVAARPPVLGLSPPRLQQLAGAMREKSAELVAVIMPVSTSRVAGSAPERNAARVALDIVRTARSDTQFVARSRRPWLNTELVTLERAAQSYESDDGALPDTTTLKLSLFTRSIQTTANQANEIARRENEAADARSKATTLAASLRNIGGRVDGTYTAQGGQQISFRVPGAALELARISGDNQFDRKVTWDSSQFGVFCDTGRCDAVRARNWWFKGKVTVEYRLRGNPTLYSCHFYVNERQAGSLWVNLLAPDRGVSSDRSTDDTSGTQGRCLAEPL